MNLTALLTALRTLMTGYFDVILERVQTLITRFNAHALSKENPHGVTKAQVGLSMVQNWEPATKTQAEGGVNNTTYMTPKRVSQYTEANVYTPLVTLFDQATQDLND